MVVCGTFGENAWNSAVRGATRVGRYATGCPETALQDASQDTLA